MTRSVALNTGARTDWFSSEIAPVREGVYEVEYGQPPVAERFAHWNGSFWGFRCGNVGDAFHYRKEEACGSIYRWRGLTEEPS